MTGKEKDYNLISAVCAGLALQTFLGPMTSMTLSIYTQSFGVHYLSWHKSVSVTAIEIWFCDLISRMQQYPVTLW